MTSVVGPVSSGADPVLAGSAPNIGQRPMFAGMEGPPVGVRFSESFEQPASAAAPAAPSVARYRRRVCRPDIGTPSVSPEINPSDTRREPRRVPVTRPVRRVSGLVAGVARDAVGPTGRTAVGVRVDGPSALATLVDHGGRLHQ